MPHKVNPIDFENAEANYGVSSSIFQHLSQSLPVSRLQRDLSDSSRLRSSGTAYGHLLVALTSTQRGLNKIEFNRKLAVQILDENPSLLAEPIQMALRRFGQPDAYEELKALSRGNDNLTIEDYRAFIKTKKDILDDKTYTHLMSLTPSTYTGLAEKLCDDFIKLTIDQGNYRL